MNRLSIAKDGGWCSPFLSWQTAEVLQGFHQRLERGCISKKVQCQQFVKTLCGFSGSSAGERRLLPAILSSGQLVYKYELSISQRFLTQGQLAFHWFLSIRMNLYFFLPKVSSLVGQVKQIHRVSDQWVFRNDLVVSSNLSPWEVHKYAGANELLQEKRLWDRHAN